MEVALSLTPRGSSYSKCSLWVTLGLRSPTLLTLSKLDKILTQTMVFFANLIAASRRIPTCLPLFLIGNLEFLPSLAPLQRGKTLLTSVLDMTRNNLMLRFQKCWSLGNAEHPFLPSLPGSLWPTVVAMIGSCLWFK